MFTLILQVYFFQCRTIWFALQEWIDWGCCYKHNLLKKIKKAPLSRSLIKKNLFFLTSISLVVAFSSAFFCKSKISKPFSYLAFILSASILSSKVNDLLKDHL